MITYKATELSRLARTYSNSGDIRLAQETSEQLVDEMKLHCTPDKVQFSELLMGIVVMPAVMWDLILYIPMWDRYNKSEMRE